MTQYPKNSVQKRHSDMPALASLDHLVLTVTDLDATLAFYSNALGMTPEPFAPADGSVRWALRFGAQKINIHVQGQELKPNAHTATPGSADLCFLTQTELSDWQDHLTKLNIVIEDGPIARTGATGPLMSIYIRDPDKNLIEISTQGLPSSSSGS